MLWVHSGCKQATAPAENMPCASTPPTALAAIFTQAHCGGDAVLVVVEGHHLRHGAFGYGDSSSPRHLREKLGCACVLSFPRASFGTGADPQIHRGRRTCCPLRGALVRVAAVPINGGAGEGEQGEQTGLLAAGTCGIGARGRRVGWAARRSGWSGREAHLARRSLPSCCVGDRVEEGDVAEEGWAQA